MAIPTVDLSPFIAGGDENGQNEAIETIKKACSEYGFFQIVNHGVPIDLMTRALQLSKTFFTLPPEEKLRYSPSPDAPLPAGYSLQPPNSPDKNEYLLMFEPQSGFNVMPNNPPDFRDVLEEMFVCFRKTSGLVEKILNDCLGLPTGFLGEYNEDRSCDFMVALRYFPIAGDENVGITEHEDGNCVTFVMQDDVGGLQVKKDGRWIPVVPAQGTIVVNLGDVIQVLSNKKFKSASHRVVRASEKSRYSFAFFYNLEGGKWVEPLGRFTEEMGQAAKYRGFVYKEYQALRLRNKTHPPLNPQDSITISHYAIPP